MIKKCIGCGALLQDNNTLLEGYTTSMTNDYCMRCFRMRNYGDYQFVFKSNAEYINILKEIGKTKDLVLYVVDFLSIPEDILNIKEYLKNNPIILVINKIDLIPSFINKSKIIDYFKSKDYNFVDVILVSGYTGFNINLLFDMINSYRTSEDVYVVGNTNAGKSTIINNLASNYNIKDANITISPMPSTTLNKIVINFNSFNLIDTPGLVDEGNILNFLDQKEIKLISPKKQIKPRTYRMSKNESLLVGNFFRIDYVEGEKNSFTFFINNDIEIKRISNKNSSLINLDKRKLKVDYRNDIVILGFGFIKTISKGTVAIYLNKDVSLFTRKSIF